MGKKKMAHKQASAKPPSITANKCPEGQPPVEARPPSPRPPQQTPTPQAPQMVSLDALAAYLRHSDPNRDLEATLAGFGQTGGGASIAGGMPVIPTPNPDIPTTVTTSTTAQTSSTPTPEKPSPTVTAPSATSKPSPRQHQINTEPLAVSPLSTYQDPSLEESEEKESEWGEEKLEEMPISEPIPEGEEREEIDLNETARKQGLMTDEEFQSLLDGVNRMEEGLALASKAVGGVETSRIAGQSEDVVHQSVAEVDERQTEEEVPESMTSQPGEREGDEQTEERDAEVPAEEPESMTSQPGAREGDDQAQEKNAKIPAEEPESVTPPVSKPKAVKRRQILKNDPKEERQKPKRVSQRCLGRGMSRKAGANTASDAVEISSEDERTTPTKPGEESLSATNQEDTLTATGMISPTPDDQKEETVEMAEGLDLASKAVGMDIPIDDDTIVCVITKPATQREPSTSARKKPEKDEEEERYLQERKRKGKAPAKKKQSNKKPHS